MDEPKPSHTLEKHIQRPLQLYFSVSYLRTIAPTIWLRLSETAWTKLAEGCYPKSCIETR